MILNSSLPFSFSLLYFLCQIYTVFTEVSLPLHLEKLASGVIPVKDSIHYYDLTLPSTIQSNKILVFSVKADMSDFSTSEGELFSDPDIWVSKSIQFPQSKESADWYCERYGSDILSIASSFVKPNDTFHIALYCQFKCKYQLLAYLADEVKLEIGKVYSINLPKQSSLNYFISVPSVEYQELNLVAMSPQFTEFKVYMQKEQVSSQNSFNVIPSWAGGYTISIVKDSKQYCTNCDYHIILQSGENEDASIQLYTYYQENVTYLSAGNPVYDTVKNNARRCYAFSVDKNQKQNSDNIIIQTIFYSGTAQLYILGWNSMLNIEYKDLPAENSEGEYKNYLYKITGEKQVWLNNEDILYFNQHIQVVDEEENQYLHFCMYSTRRASYVLSTYFLYQTEEWQRYNILLPKIEATGYWNANQTTSYKILDYSKTSNITLTLTEVKGNPKLFAYYCNNEVCYFNNEFIERKLSENTLIKATATYRGHEITISHAENTCHKVNEKINTSLNKYPCAIMAVVQCVGQDYCVYKVRVSEQGSALMMSPKTTYYNILPADSTDYYDIVVDDESIGTVVIVLNSGSGDAEWFVYEMLFEKNAMKLVGWSWNDDYIPDVVRITPKRLRKESILGTYRVRVTAKTFSSYNLYYYTLIPKPVDGTTPTDSDITWVLSAGQIIMDYYPNEVKYKIYSFVPSLYYQAPEDIKISLTRIGMNFSFKVFKSWTTFRYKDTGANEYQDRITGQDWSSDYNKELIISKGDPKYPKSQIYIVVTKDPRPGDYADDSSWNGTTIGKYFWGATVSSNPFLLNEGIQHSSTLTMTNNRQDYRYLHSNNTNPMEININVYSGFVSVYISNQTWSNTMINQRDSTIPIVREHISQFSNIIITADQLKRICDIPITQGSIECNIYIAVINTLNTSNQDSQYLISGKSTNNVPHILTPGLVRTDAVDLNDKRYYIVEEFEKRRGSVVTISFLNGYGEIYLRIPDKPEHGDSAIYPNQTHYSYKGRSNYMGEVIEIPVVEYEKITKTTPKIQLLITVIGTSVQTFDDNSEEKIEYIISYSSEPKRINQNIPYNSYIHTGEFQYYTFYFSSDVKNIYISLSNMVGDADWFLNYGNSKLPTLAESDWYSTNTNHEFWLISKNDEYFLTNHITEIGGYYTLLIFGFTNTTYTIFISAQDNPILPLSNNSPASCQCNSKDDQCYFKFNDVYVDPEIFKDNEQEIIFTSNYFYGSGVMYASLFNEKDLIESGNFNKFPSTNDHMYSNILSNHRNYMKVKIKTLNNNLYKRDSLLLLTVHCLEKSWVDINMARLEPIDYDYLNANRENIFYIKPSNHSTILSYFNFENKDLVYEIYSYTGSGSVWAYINETKYHPENDNFTNEYTALGNAEWGKDKDMFRYYNTVKASEKTYHNNIRFEIKPKSDFGFYIKWAYSLKWTSVQFNKLQDYYLSNNEFMGYFDVVNEFGNVDINVNIENYKKQQALLFVKVNVIDKSSSNNKNDNEEDRYNYNVPGENNFDYKSVNDKVLGTLLIRMTNLPKVDSESNWTVRVLFFIKLYNNIHWDSDDDGNEEENDENASAQSQDEQDKKENLISILISPSVNNIKKIQSEPFQYYFTNETTYLSVDTKVYDLNKIGEDDDTLIIEISSCSGDVDYKISNQLWHDGSIINEIATSNTNINGRKIITVPDLKSKRYYLSISPKQTPGLNCNSGNNCEKESEVSYLMYYYTGKKREVDLAKTKAPLNYKTMSDSAIMIILPQWTRDTQGDYTDMSNYKFNAFVSQNAKDYENMESVCYLSMVTNSTTIKSNIKLISFDNKIVIKGLKRGEKYYVNVLAENLKTKELITFSPIIVYAGATGNKWIIIALIVVIFVWLIIAFRFYSKYRVTKEVLKYEMNDVRNMTTVPKSESEMSNISAENEQVKYANLANNSDRI